MKVLLTGYSGFLGSHLVSTLKNDYNLTLLGRKKPEQVDCEYAYCEMTPQFDFSDALSSVDVVIHTAARVHMMDEQEIDPLSAFREVNTHATVKLARQAAEAGVKRFLFISSIKVNGESTTGRKPFSVTDVPSPEDTYGVSKAEAEEQLFRISETTGMEIVIIRPPLVYGEGVKANFASLMNFVRKGCPLPFRCIKHNKRSLVSVYNLADLIKVCIKHPKAANQVFLVSDNHDVSTADMVALMAKVQGKRNLSIPIPVFCFMVVGKILNKSDLIDRLIGSLQVDITHTMETLNWEPPYSIIHGFTEAVKI